MSDAEYVIEFVQRFNRVVAPDNKKVRVAGCCAMIQCLEIAVANASTGDIVAMANARSYARAILDMGGERVLTRKFYLDYLHVARLLAIPGEIPDTSLAFQGLDDILCLRIPPAGTRVLH